MTSKDFGVCYYKLTLYINLAVYVGVPSLLKYTKQLKLSHSAMFIASHNFRGMGFIMIQILAAPCNVY